MKNKLKGKISLIKQIIAQRRYYNQSIISTIINCLIIFLTVEKNYDDLYSIVENGIIVSQINQQELEHYEYGLYHKWEDVYILNFRYYIVEDQNI